MDQMEKYTIRKTDPRPAWEMIPAIRIAHSLWCPNPGITAAAKVAYSDYAIHVLMQAEEADVRAAYRGRPWPVSEDSCLEFFFCPAREDKRYFNFEFNPNAALFLGFGDSVRTLTRLMVWDEEDLFAPAVNTSPGGWQIEYQIPTDFIRRFFPSFRIASGYTIRANCYKCGDKTPHPHYLAWNNIKSATPDFHRPQDFGCMMFE